MITTHGAIGHRSHWNPPTPLHTLQQCTMLKHALSLVLLHYMVMLQDFLREIYISLKSRSMTTQGVNAHGGRGGGLTVILHRLGIGRSAVD